MDRNVFLLLYYCPIVFLLTEGWQTSVLRNQCSHVLGTEQDMYQNNCLCKYDVFGAEKNSKCYFFRESMIPIEDLLNYEHLP